MTVLKIKNVVLVAFFIFLKYNGLCERLADLNCFYTEESISSTNFCVCITPLMHVLHAWS